MGCIFYDNAKNKLPNSVFTREVRANTEWQSTQFRIENLKVRIKINIIAFPKKIQPLE